MGPTAAFRLTLAVPLHVFASGRRIEIRAYTEFRECSVADAEALTSWLAEHVASIERREHRVHEQLLARCRSQLIEPPTSDRVSEISRSACASADRRTPRRGLTRR